MSLCIAMNNPGNFILLAGDGRIIRNDKIIKDNHDKVTKLNSHAVIYTSGVQEAAEELRESIKSKINDYTRIEAIAKLVQQESLRIHQKFLKKKPEIETYCNGGHTTMATLIGFYDILTNTSGYYEFRHIDNFQPIMNINSEVKTWGIGQDYALKVLLNNHSFGMEPTNNILNVYDVVSLTERKVGGAITIYTVNRSGVKKFRREVM